MYKLLFVFLLVSLNGYADITWANKARTSPWPGSNGGFIGLTNSFDSVSNTTVAYVQSFFVGTVSVTNGSPNVTWVSGDKFSVLWHNPNQIIINSTTQQVATATIPGGCVAGNPVSCTTFVMAANWAGSTGTFAYTASSPQGTHIYSDAIAYYSAASNTWQWGPRWGSLDDECLTSTTGYNLPNMRQNAGVFSMDTKRHRLYMGTGVNNTCNFSNVLTNGTSTITLEANGTSPGANSGHTFVQAPGLWTGLTVYFQSAVTTCLITAVSNEYTATIGSCSNGFPNTGLSLMQVQAPDMPGGGGGAQGPIWDFWYLPMSATPPSSPSAFVSVPMGALEVNFPFYNLAELAYDSDDDGFLLFGSSGIAGTGHDTWVFCSADSPGSGTLTARQTQMGCVSSNTWVEVLSGGSPISHPPGVFTPGVVYDTTNHRFWQFGGASLYSVGHFQTDVWQYCPTSTDSCGTPQTWSAMGSTSQPPAASTIGWIYPPSIVLATGTGSLIFHLPDTPADYSCVLGTSPCAWTTISFSGTGPGAGARVATAYDSSQNAIIAIPQGVGGNVWVGQLPPIVGLCGTGSGTNCPDGLIGKPYSQQIAAVGGGPITYAVTAGALPGPFTLSSSGLLSGTPNNVGIKAYTFTVTATNGSGASTPVTFALTLSASLGNSTATCLDVDGDRYGVGPGCVGPDADDSDATVKTVSHALAKWSTLAAFWAHMGWNPNGVLFVDGGAGTCSRQTAPFVYSAGTACATVDDAIAAMSAGDAVVVKSGTYNRTATISIKTGTLSGTSCSAYSYYLAYPGEQPDFEWTTGASSVGISYGSTTPSLNESCFVLDGWKLVQNNHGIGTGISANAQVSQYGVVISHNDISGFTRNVFPQFSATNFQITNNYLHDAYAGGDFGHVIYIGSDCPGGGSGFPSCTGITSTGTVIAGNILANADDTCLHANGPMSNLLIDSNLIYGCSKGINLQSGISHSTFQNNVVHTIAKYLFQLNTYTSSYSTQLWQCHDQNFNVLRNNTFIEDGQTFNISRNSTDPGSTDIYVVDGGNAGGNADGQGCKDQSGHQPDLGNNTYDNNIFVHDCATGCNSQPANSPSSKGAIARYSQLNVGEPPPGWLATDTWRNNVIKNFDVTTQVIDPLGNSVYQNCTWFTNTANVPLGSGNLCDSNPLFAAIDPVAWATLPNNWNLSVFGSSPAVGAALASDVPTFDAVGAVRGSTPTIGAYERAPLSISPTPLAWTTGAPYSRVLLSWVSGGTGPMTFQTTPVTGSFPPGLTLSSAGVLSGTVTGSAQTYTFTIKVTDSAVSPATVTSTAVTFVVNAVPSISTASPLNTATYNSVFTQTLTASNGTQPYGAWSISAGSLPAGLTLNPATGAIGGTPTRVGLAQPFTVRVTDTANVQATKAFTMDISPIFSYGSTPHTPVNCSTAAGYPALDLALCTITGEYPLGTFSVPAVGGTIVDQNFGTVSKVISKYTGGATGAVHGYYSPNALSATNKYMLISRPLGAGSTVIDAVTGATIRAGVPASVTSDTATWDAYDDNYFYHWVGVALKKYNVVTGADTTVKDYSVSIDPRTGLTYTFTSAANGGNGDTSKDNWKPFYTDTTSHNVCIVNLGPTGTIGETHCIDYRVTHNGRTPIEITDPAANGCTYVSRGVDSVSGKRYVIAITQPMVVFSFKPGVTAAGALDFEELGPEVPNPPYTQAAPGGNQNNVCENTETCASNQHNDMFEAADGQQYMFSKGEQDGGGPGGASRVLFVFYRMNAGQCFMRTPTEAASSGCAQGAGGRIDAVLHMPAGTWFDGYLACAKQTDVCVWGGARDAAYPIPPGNSGGFGSTRSHLDTTTVVPHLPREGIIYAFKGMAQEMRALLYSRTVLWDDDNYWGNMRTSISNDGTTIVYDSNFGHPNGPQNENVLTAPTGFAASAPSITITTASLANGVVNQTYSPVTMAATGGTPPYTWSVTAGALPNGISMNSAGLISGTPTLSGTFNATITATDSLSLTALHSYTIVIGCAVGTTSPLPTATIGIPYNQTISAPGCATPVSWSLLSGALPDGLTFGSDGVLSGTPTVLGSFSFTVRVTDTNGLFGDLAAGLSVASGFSINGNVIVNGNVSVRTN